MSKQLHTVAAWLARFGSGLFMVVQMIILLDMTQNWNDDWVSKEDDRCVFLQAAKLGTTATVLFKLCCHSSHC